MATSAPPASSTHTGFRRWLIPAAYVVALGGFEVLRAVALHGSRDTWANVAFAFILLAAGFKLGLTSADMGLEPTHAGRGARYGLAAWGVFAAGLALVVAIPATRSFFDDQRSSVSTGTMLLTVLIVIPLGTALLEEIAFRGVLLGLCLQRTTMRAAVLISSVCFGLWHIIPTLSTASSNETLDKGTGSPLALTGLLVGMVFAMTIAGVIFCWLRLRSKSLLAPFLFHAGVNSTAFFYAWLVVRG